MFLDSACALDCWRLFRFRRAFSPHGFPPFFHVFGPSDMKLLKSLSSKDTQGFQAFQGQIMASFGLPTMRFKVLLGRDWCHPTHHLGRRGSFPTKWDTQTHRFPQQKQVIPIFSVLSLSKRCLILSTFLAETFLLGFHHIISYPKNTNSEVKRKDSNEWYILFTVPIRSCCLLWSLLPWFCLKKSSSHLYLYIWKTLAF